MQIANTRHHLSEYIPHLQVTQRSKGTCSTTTTGTVGAGRRSGDSVGGGVGTTGFEHVDEVAHLHVLQHQVHLVHLQGAR